jgi:adenylate cyclase
MGGVAAVISLGIWQIGGWTPLENLGYNTLFQIRHSGILPQPKWDKRIAVIAIDEATLQKYGRFPFGRDRYVQLLQALTGSDFAAIGFDILFVEPSADDSKLADAIAAKGNVVLAIASDDKGKPLPIVPSLAEVAAAQGQILQQADGDGISRQAKLLVNEVPSLGLAMLQIYNTDTGQSQQFSIPRQSGKETLQPVWINWPGRTQSLPTYSFADVVEGKFSKNAFTGKLVLVGIAATGFDPMLTPLNKTPPTYGMYLHAAVIDNLLNNRLLRTLDNWKIVLLLLLLGPAASGLLSTQKLTGRIILMLLLPLIWYGTAIVLFTFNRQWIPIAAPVGTILLAGVAVQLREQQEKQQLMSLFEKYMAPETAQLIWQRKAEIFQNSELVAQEMLATVLFMDIRGFTTISEQLSPRELFEWLNQYLDAMSDCIMNHGGIIDKYIGDAIMAVFGIPFPRTKLEEIQQDAGNAIAASLAMYERLQQLNQKFEAQGKPKIEFGIGIHTGNALAGSLGGSRRLNFSVVGDTVNIAARLEAMNKDLKQDNPYRLLITGETFEHVRDRYDGKLVKQVQVRGREKQTDVYTILGLKSSN